MLENKDLEYNTGEQEEKFSVDHSLDELRWSILFDNTKKNSEVMSGLPIESITSSAQIDRLASDTSGRVHIIFVWKKDAAEYASREQTFAQYAAATDREDVALRSLDADWVLGSLFLGAGEEKWNSLVFLQYGDIVHNMTMAEWSEWITTKVDELLGSYELPPSFEDQSDREPENETTSPDIPPWTVLKPLWSGRAPQKKLGSWKPEQKSTTPDKQISSPQPKKDIPTTPERLAQWPWLKILAKVEVVGDSETIGATFLNDAQTTILLKSSLWSQASLALRVSYPELYTAGTTRTDRIVIGKKSYQMTIKNIWGEIRISLVREKSSAESSPTVVWPEPLSSVAVDLRINGIAIRRLDTWVYTKTGARLPASREFGRNGKELLPYLNGVDEGKLRFDKPLLWINPTSTQLNVWYDRKDLRHNLPIKFMLQADGKGTLRLYVEPSAELLEKYASSSPDKPSDTSSDKPTDKPSPPQDTPPKKTPERSPDTYSSDMEESEIVTTPKGEEGIINTISDAERPTLHAEKITWVYKVVRGIPAPRTGKIFAKYIDDRVIIYRKVVLGQLDYAITRIELSELERWGGIFRKGRTAPVMGDEISGEINVQIINGVLEVTRSVETPEWIIEYEKDVPLLQQRPTSARMIESHINITNPDGTITKHPWENRQRHQGVDILPRVSEKRPDVKPVLPGEVVFVENAFADNVFPDNFERIPGTFQRWRSKIKNNHGNYVIVRHNPPGNVFTMYAHLKAWSIDVEVGDKVGLNTVIGKMGNTWTVRTRIRNQTYPAKHLHLEYFRMNTDFWSPESYAANRWNWYKSKKHWFTFLDPAVYLPVWRKNRSSPPEGSVEWMKQTGKASRYDLPWNKTASGEMFNAQLLAAAHFKLPFGTRVKVTNKKNNKSVIVRINDKWPYDRASPKLTWKWDNLWPDPEKKIDLTPAAFKAISDDGKLWEGVLDVNIEEVK
jgi:murein DD-endopeptidase MepM/ murein hydrolase activator NlpD